MSATLPSPTPEDESAAPSATPEDESVPERANIEPARNDLQSVVGLIRDVLFAPTPEALRRLVAIILVVAAALIIASVAGVPMPWA